MSLPAISGRSDKIRQAATKERRSALYRWMLANFDDFKATVAEAGRPNWKALSEAFGTEGLLDRNGNTPTDSSVFSAPNVELSRGVPSGAAKEVVAVGQPTFAGTSDGGVEMYFVYYQRNDAGFDVNINRFERISRPPD